MKREFIKEQVPDISKEALDAIMDENGKDIEAAKAPAAALTAERDNLKARLEEVNGKLEGYDPEWKAKAEQADIDAKAKIAEMQSDMLIREALAGYAFTSGFAKDGVTARVKAAGLKVSEDGKSLLGLSDLLSAIQEENPDAFRHEEKPGSKTPFAVAGTQRTDAKIQEPGSLRDAISAAMFPKKD